MIGGAIEDENSDSSTRATEKGKLRGKQGEEEREKTRAEREDKEAHSDIDAAIYQILYRRPALDQPLDASAVLLEMLGERER